MVAIIDYGMGNLASVKKALDYLKVENCITSDFRQIEHSSSILLPGVGSFYQGMENLRARELDKILTDEVLGKKKNFFGICLGMQLLAETGTEPFECEGLGWIKGKVEAIFSPGVRVPHMGWNNIKARNDTHLSHLSDQDFYFIHSYHFIPKDTDIIAATVNYGEDLVASIQTDNIFATQFHPEKSQISGISLLKSFFSADVKN